jgi:O-methyltransferase
MNDVRNFMDRVRSPIRNQFDRVRGRSAFHFRLMCWAYGPQFREWCRFHPCEDFAERDELYRFLLDREGLDGPIDYLEFGVSAGSSLRWWVENSRHSDSTFVGFDSFEGLPEDWGNWPKGSFSTDGRIPDIVDSRCNFVKGLFHESVPSWLTHREFTRRVVVHLDADLYTSTLMVLTQLLPKLKQDDILIFDQFASYLDEYRAFIDATQAYGRSFVPIGRTGEFGRVAMKAT